MKIDKALEQITQIIQQGREERLNLPKVEWPQPNKKYRHMGSVHPSGKVEVYDGIMRSVEPCEHCGQLRAVGTITLLHEDGRAVTFDYALFHLVQAGHTLDDAPIEQIIELMQDAG